MTLSEIAAALGCSRSTACRLRAGTYRHGGPLARRYLDLVQPEPPAPGLLPVPAERTARRRVLAQICQECPRSSCDGCRIAEIDH